MATLPNLPTTVAAIYKAIEDAENGPPRSHLGASQIGRPCERDVWLAFRWAEYPHFHGKLLRLFRRGKLEESVIIADMRTAGFTIHDADPETGAQFVFSDHGGHMGGSMDGAGLGFPEAPETWHVLEFKTHNSKSFDAMEKNGVASTKPEHYDQMQMYMGWSGMDRALYVAVCKDDDRLYCERVAFNKKRFEDLRAKAERIIFSETPPPKINKSPAFYLCKLCEMANVCHGEDFPRVNCRTCAHSTAMRDGTWKCARHDKLLSKEEQRAACDSHLFHPSQLEEILGQPVDGDQDAILYNHEIHGRIANVANGATSFADIGTVFTSKELTKLKTDQLAAVVQVKKQFGGTVRT